MPCVKLLSAAFLASHSIQRVACCLRVLAHCGRSLSIRPGSMCIPIVNCRGWPVTAEYISRSIPHALDHDTYVKHLACMGRSIS